MNSFCMLVVLVCALPVPLGVLLGILLLYMLCRNVSHCDGIYGTSPKPYDGTKRFEKNTVSDSSENA